MSKFDHRRRERYEEILRQLPDMEARPHVGPADLEEVAKVFKGLPELSFPINSSGELLDQLGEDGLEVEGMKVDPSRMLKYMPAHYFPIPTLVNLVEKMGALVRENRKHVDIPTEMNALRRQLPKLQFPIENVEQLMAQVGDKTYTFQGGPVQSREIRERIPDYIFPIESRPDFDAKVRHLMATRPLIVAD